MLDIKRIREEYEEVKKAVELKLQGTPPKSGEGRSYMSQMRAALGLK